MFNRLWKRFLLLEEAGDAGAGGGGTAAPAAATANAGAAAATGEAGAGNGAAAGAEAAAGDGLTPPESLLGDKPGEEKKPEEGGEKKEGEGKGEEAKPIEYTDFKVPDGVTLDPAQMDAYKAIAGKHNLPQETAQELVDMHVAEIKKAQEAPYRAWNELQTKWRDEVKNDPVIGGANLEKNLASTKAGLQSLLGNDAPKFFEALNITGAGNNPDIVRGLMKAAAPHAPATPIAGSPGNSGGQKTAGATLYPTQAGLGNGHQE